MYKVFIIAILLAVTSCSKNSEKADAATTVTVKEYGSNTPVAQASVTFSKSGIDGISTIFTGYTDKDGICQVPKNIYNGATFMGVGAPGYWPADFLEITTDIMLNAEGWIRVAGITTPVNVHPDASVINIYPVGQSSGRTQIGPNLLPIDNDTILLRAYAGEKNSVVWQLLSSNSDTVNRGEERDIMVPRFDTVDVVQLNGY